MISINAPQIGEEEIEAVVNVLKSGILTHSLGAGPVVTKFEKEFAEFANAKHAIAVNTGTAALHAAILAANVKPGEEVILPSFTFVATAEAVVMAGAKPVFVDVNPETYTILPRKIEEAMTRKTKAIVPVDLYGLPADVRRIKEIAEKHGLVVIEDAAQAHGATYRDKPAGFFADAACWSFYASKNMTTGEGGIVTTSNDDMADKMRLVRSHGEKAKYASLMLGYNYRMTEIQAAIGCVQLRRLPTFLSKRRRNARRLTAILERTEKLQLPREPENFGHSWYLYTVRLKDATETERNGIVEELKKKGVGAEVYYVNPVHLMPYYRSSFGEFRLPETEKAAKQVISLPVHPAVKEEQIDYIGETLLHLLA
ncbi:MAG: DegT/DnrJ/EryC1/StrS family aminotransferase [Candidatus Bathycorpusculaceae bacterium]